MPFKVNLCGWQQQQQQQQCIYLKKYKVYNTSCRYSTFPLNSLYASNRSFEELNFFAVVLQYHIPANLASVMPSMCLFQFLLDFFKVELKVGGFIYLFIYLLLLLLI